ncbi:MerR family transcriptional regulator [Bacillus salitolerans]|uniref:MerR family transcriptional regulator n=1 Tax=Bacillus salitolerans TaxID=1437434 RepID=A0ABW4LIF5_9BACI
MTTFMTIKAFSEKTGISKSALRYYESKKLLELKERNSSGYRVYTDDQIEIAKLISSLRIAGIPVNDIQSYLSSDEAIKRQLMESWIKKLKKKKHLLDVSLHYLERENRIENIYLTEKSKEKIVWFSAESEVGKFQKQFEQKGKLLENMNIPIKNCYLKYVSGVNPITAHIGFGIPFEIEINGKTNIHKVEIMDACVCISMSYKEPISNIHNGYKTLMKYAADHQWLPASSILEWYHGENFSELDLLMPVIQMEKRREL